MLYVGSNFTWIQKKYLDVSKVFFLEKKIKFHQGWLDIIWST